MIKDSIYTFLTRISYIIGKIIYFRLVNSTLGTAGKGLFELIQLAPNILTNFGTFGFNESNTYFAGRKPARIPGLITNSYRLSATFSIVAIILGVGFILLPMNQGIFENIPRWVGFLALAVIPIAILDLFLEAILYGENRIWIRNCHEIIRISSGIVFMGILVVICKLYVPGAVYGFLLVHLALLGFTFFFLRRFHKPVIREFNPELVKDSWKFGRFCWGANFAGYLLLNVDKWLIYLLAAEGTRFDQVGLYATAANIVVNIWIIPNSIQTALIPKITQKGESERKKLVPTSMRVVTIIVLLIMVLLVLIGKPVLAILGNRPGADWDFRQAYTPLMLLLPAIFTMSLAKLFTADFFSRGKPHFAMWVSILSLAINVIINFILIPSDYMIGSLPIGGMNGAAIASSIAYTISFFVFLYLYIRESGEKSRDIFIPKKSDFELLWLFVSNLWRKSNPDDGPDKGVGS